MDRADRAARLDVWEHRGTPGFEFRADADGPTLVLEGYASTFTPYDMYGGPAAGGWTEQLSRRAFDATLSEKPDVHLLINHEGMPLARTKSGTLNLSVDRHGLKVNAELDRSDPDVQRLEPKMLRGDMNEMSFAFRVRKQEWSAADGSDDPQSFRTITDVNLHKGDVSIVNFGANDTTHAELHSLSDAVDIITALDLDELVEVRADRDKLGDAVAKLRSMMRRCEPSAGVPRERSLQIALAVQGLASDDGVTMKLSAAIAQVEQTDRDLIPYVCLTG